MAFKMKLSSKELDGPYNFSNTHTDAIKSGSGALGESGSIGLAAPALQTDDTYTKVTESEDYVSGWSRGGERPNVGDKMDTSNGSIEVTDKNDAKNLTNSQKSRGVKVNRKTNTTVKDDTKYEPQFIMDRDGKKKDNPKVGQIIK